MIAMPNLKSEYRAQVQSFIKALDYSNNVSPDVDYKMSKIKEEAFLPRWLTALVAEEVRAQGVKAPNVLNFGSPVFTNKVIQKDGEDYYGFDMCNVYTQKDHAPMTINALTKTVDNYVTFRIMWLDQSNQALPRHHPIHLDQEQLLAGLLALASVLGVGEGHLLHRETRWVGSRYFAKSESLFQSFPRNNSMESYQVAQKQSTQPPIAESQAKSTDHKNC
jgi:hypothetical protein